MRKRLDSLRRRIFSGREVRENAAWLSQSNARAVLEVLRDAAVLGGKRCCVVLEDLSVGMRVKMGCYGEEF